MKRRDLIAGALIAVAVRRARAQQTGKVYRIAVVSPATPIAEMRGTAANPAVARLYGALFGELRRLGYVEGQNLVVERYSGEGRAEHHPELASEVARTDPEVIIALTNYLVLDFKAATTTVPIVGTFSQPIESGIVSNLARPEGNITGVSVDVGSEQWGKRYQLLKETAPHTSRVGLLASRAVREQFDAVTRKEFSVGGFSLVGPPLDAPFNEAEYRRVFAALAQEGADGLVVNDESMNFRYQRLIVELAEKGRLPAIYTSRDFVGSGGLMSYGVDWTELYRHIGDSVDKILRGSRPSEIPIFRPTKFELVINLKNAKALGLTIPPSLLAIADEVIE